MAEIKTVQPKRRELGFDVIRIIAAFLVASIHFSSSYHDLGLNGFTDIFTNDTTVNLGTLAVTLFFILSGATLYRNNLKTPVLTFYKKRWFGIFPLFYFCYIPLRLIICINQKSIFFGLNPAKYLLTLFGLDGYFSFISPNYYLIGEWFLGILLFLYLIFPLLRKIPQKFALLTALVFFVGYLTIFFVDYGIYPSNENVFNCIFWFYMGIVFEIYKDKINKVVGIISIIASILLIFVPLPFNFNVRTTLSIIFTFIAIYYIFKGIDTRNEETRNNFAVKSIIFSSNLTFPVFMVHHFFEIKAEGIIARLCNYNNVLTYIITMILVYLLSTIVYFAFNYCKKLVNKIRK